MAPIRRFRRLQQQQQKEAVEAPLGFEALSLLDGNAPLTESAMHLPRPGGQGSAGESGKPAAAQSDIGLKVVEPATPLGQTQRATLSPRSKGGSPAGAPSLLAGNAPADELGPSAQTESATFLPRSKGGSPAGESSKPPLPPKPTRASGDVQIGLKRMEPTNRRSPPQADEVEAVALQEKSHQPSSPRVRFEVPPVHGWSPRNGISPMPSSRLIIMFIFLVFAAIVLGWMTATP